MSALTEKTTQNEEVPMSTSDKDIYHGEQAEKVSPYGSDGVDEEEEEYHFTIGKFLAILVSINYPLRDSPSSGLSYTCITDTVAGYATGLYGSCLLYSDGVCHSHNN